MEKETLKEAAEKRIPTSTKIWDLTETRRSDFIAGAEWQAEKMYSEEDMIKFAMWVYLEVGLNSGKDRTNEELFKEWFKQFKKE